MKGKVVIKVVASWLISGILLAAIFPIQFFWLFSGVVSLIINLVPFSILGSAELILDKMKMNEGINRLCLYLVIGIACFIWIGVDWRAICVGAFYGLLYYMSKYAYFLVNTLKY